VRRLGLLILAVALGASAPAVAAPGVTHRCIREGAVEVHVLTVPKGASVHPVAARPGKTVPGWARASGAVAAINGGYFNHSDGWPVSHVTIAGRAATDPEKNRALTSNPALKPVLPIIFNHRAEWRALMGPMGRSWAIAAHDAPAPWGQTIDDALQAGPQLLPTLDLAGEAFVRQDARGRITRDGIGALGRAARSAIGLTPDGSLLLVASAGVTRRGTGLTIAQLAGLMKRLGAAEALALDGGSSTTLSWTEHGRLKTFVGGGTGPALVNSALVVE
jgi:hypothetical protein